MAVEFSMFNLFFTIIPLFLLSFFGAWFRSRGYMDSRADTTIFWLVVNFFTPCLIIDTFLGNRSLSSFQNVLVAPALGYATVLLGIVFAKLIAKKIAFSEKEQESTFTTCVSLYNYGYIPIPIVMLFFNKEVLGMLLLFNAGLDFALWTAGFLMLAGKGSLKDGLKHLITPPLVAIVGALCLNLIFVENPLPFGAARMLHMVGQATIPVALLLIGAMVFDHVPVVKSISPVRPIVYALILRLLFLPAIFVLLAHLLPLSNELKIVLCVQAGMPSAVLPIMLVRQYGGDLSLAIRIVVATSVVCIITMPIWLALAFSWWIPSV
jgi:malate permease and related proteins